MITGLHAIMFSAHAEKARAFLADVLQLPSVDAGGGWLIYAVSPAELAVHAADGAARHELYLMCDDIETTLADLRSRGAEIARDVTDQGWGRLAALRLPDGEELPIYQPRHPSPHPDLEPDSDSDSARAAERMEVQRAVVATPAEIFAVLSDPRGHVAIDSSGMLMSASGNPVGAVGDTFVVHMDREALNDYPLGLYDVTVEIVTFEPDREIAWTPRGNFNIGHVYGYRLAPIAAGTLVTSYYDWSMIEQSWKDAGIFPVVPESALRATLGILARTVAPGQPRPEISDA